MYETLIYLLLLALLAWFWLDSLRSREIATHTCKAVCRRDQLQFLDDTVSLQHLGLGRDGKGTVRVRRAYRFEYASSGDRRYQGLVVMLGSQLQVLNMETQDGEPEHGSIPRGRLPHDE
jgi:hypothetical protein